MQLYRDISGGFNNDNDTTRYKHWNKSTKMSRSTYSQIEIGKRNIFASDLITLKKIFKTSYDELFKGLIPINKYENENKE